jgi:hypothetical protein
MSERDDEDDLVIRPSAAAGRSSMPDLPDDRQVPAPNVGNKKRVSFDDARLPGASSSGSSIPLLPLNIDSSSKGDVSHPSPLVEDLEEEDEHEELPERSPLEKGKMKKPKPLVKSVTNRLVVRLSVGMYENQEQKYSGGVKVVGQHFKVISSPDSEKTEDKNSSEQSSLPKLSRAETSELSSTSQRDSSTFYYQSGLDDIAERMQVDFLELVKCFLYHVLYPISIPFMGWYEGWTLVSNYAFIPKKGDNMFFVQIFQLFFIASPIIYWYNPRDLPHVSPLEIIAPLALYVVHKIMVGTKYAMQTPEFIRKMRTEPITSEQHAAMMLLTAWLNPSEKFLHSLLEKSSDSLLVDFKKMTFSVYHKRYQTESLAPPSAICPGKTTNLDEYEAVSQICAAEYCKFMADTVFEIAYKTIGRLRWIFQILICLVFAVTPEAVRVYQGHPTWQIGGWKMWLIVMTSIFGSSFFASTFVGFNIISVADLFRRYAFLNILTDLIDPLTQENIYLKVAGKLTIHVDITNEKNLGTWAAVRELFLVICFSILTFSHSI